VKNPHSPVPGESGSNVQSKEFFASTIPSSSQSLINPDLSLPLPCRLPQSSRPFMSLSEHDRWNIGSPILTLVPASKISQITSLGEPAKPLTVTSSPTIMLSMSANKVLPTDPFHDLIRTASVPSQIIVNTLIGLLHSNTPLGGDGTKQVFVTTRVQAGVMNPKSMVGWNIDHNYYVKYVTIT
jgi:hypothetical protein